MPEPSTSAASVRVEPVRFRALDGCPLGGTLYVAESSRCPADAAVFAAGTGIRAAVYRAFLTHLAHAGMPVLAFDYRGIGASRPDRLRGFEAGFEDWTEYDAGAAIRWMRDRYPQARLAGIGHSAGAMIVGATEHAAMLAQLVAIAPHTGYFGDHAASLRFAMRYGWRTVARIVTPALGYFPARLIGAEDLPARVAMQWSACTKPGFDGGIVQGDVARGRRVIEHAAALRLPTLVLSVHDDAWATEIGVRRYLHAFRNLLAIRRIVTPADVPDRGIGHFGFFRRSLGPVLWPIVTRFLLGSADRAVAAR